MLLYEGAVLVCVILRGKVAHFFGILRFNEGAVHSSGRSTGLGRKSEHIA